MVSESVEDCLESGLPRLSRLGAVVCFDLGGDGAWVIDARGTSASLMERDETDEEPDCTIRLSRDNLEKLLNGKLDPMLGYAMGKIKVSGSLGIAMKMVNAIA